MPALLAIIVVPHPDSDGDCLQAGELAADGANGPGARPEGCKTVRMVSSEQKNHHTGKEKQR